MSKLEEIRVNLDPLERLWLTVKSFVEKTHYWHETKVGAAFNNLHARVLLYDQCLLFRLRILTLRKPSVLRRNCTEL